MMGHLQAVAYPLPCKFYVQPYFTLEMVEMRTEPNTIAAKIVFKQVTKFYEKGGIPMLKEQSCCQKIVKLVEENEKFRRIPKDRRTNESSIRKVDQYNEELSKTFAL
ncbi:hypothetical protein SNE40_010834 [Patella caerulea]|uniref:Uncharacterized protein n=1 Tax=Patella caerulea TaxID=87958 RepID=A0AAN8JZ09_PATCE